MVYLAFATLVTAAVLPIPLRTAGAAARDQRSPAEPPLPVGTDDVVAPLIAADVPDEGCAECDDDSADLSTVIAGLAESVLAAGPGWLAETEDDDELAEDDLSVELMLGEASPGFSRGDQLADLAAGLAGLSYQWGGISPSTGFDCSGLVYYVHRQFGATLNRDAASQFANGRSVQRGDLQTGDIVFFSDTYTSGISHDGIYLGGGRFVHAVSPGSGVRITSMGDDYWGPRYAGARRVFE